jgi:hypothetical protein
MAKYMLLIYGEPSRTAHLDEAAMKEHIDEYWAYDDALKEIGALMDGWALHPVETAKTVAPGGVVTDGPFAETTEVLGGFYTINVPDQAAALEWAAKVPGVVRGFTRVEVRPIMEFEEPG